MLHDLANDGGFVALKQAAEDRDGWRHRERMSMKKRSEATQTLHAGCSKVDPQTNTQTDRGDYNTLCSLACSVKICCRTEDY